MKNLLKLIVRFLCTKIKATPRFSQLKIIDYFARESHISVQGWLSSYSLSMVKIISDFQIKNNICGNIAEIGVFHGRFFVALCLLMQETEDAVAIDVFDKQELNIDNSGVGDYGKFLKNITDFLAPNADIKIIHKDSLVVSRSRLLGVFDNTYKVRLFSVDGCHTVEHTESDLRLAEEAIVDGGIIILDDYGNVEWPGVKKGLDLFLEKSLQIMPIALSYNKLYLTTKSYYGRYFEWLQMMCNGKNTDHESIEIRGVHVLVLQPPTPESLFQDSFANFFDFSKETSSAFLQDGWFDIEKWGVWSDGSQAATIRMNNFLKGSDNCELVMVIALHAFVSIQARSVLVDIRINKIKVDSVHYSYGTDYINWKLKLPVELLNASCWNISFYVRDAKSPRELGISADERILGVGLRTISFY